MFAVWTARSECRKDRQDLDAAHGWRQSKACLSNTEKLKRHVEAAFNTVVIVVIVVDGDTAERAQCGKPEPFFVRPTHLMPPSPDCCYGNAASRPQKYPLNDFATVEFKPITTEAKENPRQPCKSTIKAAPIPRAIDR
jgi:hypothetical protein